MGDVFDQRQQSLAGTQARGMRVSTPTGPTFVSMNDEFQEPQGIKEETRRSIRRAILTPCGQQALEIVEEHHIVYARPRHSSPQSSDSVRTVLASIVSFLIVALTFTAAGGGDQSLAWAPVYWVAFLLLWSWLA